MSRYCYWDVDRKCVCGFWTRPYFNMKLCPGLTRIKITELEYCLLRELYRLRDINYINNTLNQLKESKINV